MIRTKENFIDKINEDHVWRLREIAELRAVITDPKLSKTRLRALSRSGVALLYAHWEGFVKKSGSYVLEYLAMQRLSNNQLKINYIALGVKARLDESNKSRKFSMFGSIADEIISYPTNRARVPFKKVVDTEGNLSSTVLQEIAWCVGINYDFFKTKEKLIDQHLVGRRNHVAHGEQTYIELDDYLALSDEVLGLMGTFKNLIENLVHSEEYLKV